MWPNVFKTVSFSSYFHLSYSVFSQILCYTTTTKRQIPFITGHVTFLWEKYSHIPDHERAPNCYNWKSGGDCSGLNGHWQHCILYNCDACAFRDNLADIYSELAKKKIQYSHYLLYFKQIFHSSLLLLGFWTTRQGKI